MGFVWFNGDNPLFVLSIFLVGDLDAVWEGTGDGGGALNVGICSTWILGLDIAIIFILLSFQFLDSLQKRVRVTKTTIVYNE